MSLYFSLKSFSILLRTTVHFSNNIKASLHYSFSASREDYDSTNQEASVEGGAMDLCIFLQSLNKLELLLQINHLIMDGWEIALHFIIWTLLSVPLLRRIASSQDVAYANSGHRKQRRSLKHVEGVLEKEIHLLCLRKALDEGHILGW